MLGSGDISSLIVNASGLRSATADGEEAQTQPVAAIQILINHVEVNI